MKTKIYLTLVVFVTSSLLIKAQTKTTPEVLDPKPSTEKGKTVAKSTSKSAEDNFDLKAHNDSLSKLQTDAEELNTMALKIRNDSKGKQESVKRLLISEARNLEQQSQVVQVAASNLSSRINSYKFNKNKTAIKGQVAKVGENNVPVYTKNLIFDSEKIMRLAKEMREEANAQPNIASKLGTMSNADEQEEVAIGKQVEALTNLENLSRSAISASK